MVGAFFVWISKSVVLGTCEKHKFSGFFLHRRKLDMLGLLVPADSPPGDAVSEQTAQMSTF